MIKVKPVPCQIPLANMAKRGGSTSAGSESDFPVNLISHLRSG